MSEICVRIFSTLIYWSWISCKVSHCTTSYKTSGISHGALSTIFDQFDAEIISFAKDAIYLSKLLWQNVIERGNPPDDGNAARGRCVPISLLCGFLRILWRTELLLDTHTNCIQKFIFERVESIKLHSYGLWLTARKSSTKSKWRTNGKD